MKQPYVYVTKLIAPYRFQKYEMCKADGHLIYLKTTNEKLRVAHFIKTDDTSPELIMLLQEVWNAYSTIRNRYIELYRKVEKQLRQWKGIEPLLWKDYEDALDAFIPAHEIINLEFNNHAKRTKET
jgi:hypothetical protein